MNESELPQFKKDLSIDITDLDNEVRTHASMYFHYASGAADARSALLTAKIADDLECAHLYTLHLERLTKLGKSTIAQIESAVKCDPRWEQSRLRVVAAQKIADVASESREAFTQRKDMLVQLTVDRRREGEGELRIRVAQASNGDARSDVLKMLAQQREHTAA